MQTAEEIYQQIIEKYPNISMDTVYRNLNLLQQLNIVCEANFGDGKNRFRLCGDKHHHHMICLKCGCLLELDFCPMELIQDKINNKKFHVTNHSFEIFGYCDKCL